MRTTKGTLDSEIASLGTKTRYGKVQGVQMMHNERYYFLVDSFGNVAYMPATLIEKEYPPNAPKQPRGNP